MKNVWVWNNKTAHISTFLDPNTDGRTARSKYINSHFLRLSSVYFSPVSLGNRLIPSLLFTTAGRFLSFKLAIRTAKYQRPGYTPNPEVHSWLWHGLPYVCVRLGDWSQNLPESASPRDQSRLHRHALHLHLSPHTHSLPPCGSSYRFKHEIQPLSLHSPLWHRLPSPDAAHHRPQDWEIWHRKVRLVLEVFRICNKWVKHLVCNQSTLSCFK